MGKLIAVRDLRSGEGGPRKRVVFCLDIVKSFVYWIQVANRVVSRSAEHAGAQDFRNPIGIRVRAVA